MKSSEFVSKAKDIARLYKTLYVMGSFGAPLTEPNKARYKNNHSYNRKTSRRKMIETATNDTFAFDCSGLIKGILWGWFGDNSQVYGGAKYGSNNVPDISANQMIKVCSEVSEDFLNIKKGEIVWMKGHVGIYVGNGEVVECTPSWTNNVQITKLSQREWLRHGKLPYIDYEASEELDITGYYYPICESKYTSIVDALKSIGEDSSFTYRTRIANKNGIMIYIGSATQNVRLLKLLKEGKLIKV